MDQDVSIPSYAPPDIPTTRPSTPPPSFVPGAPLPLACVLVLRNPNPQLTPTSHELAKAAVRELLGDPTLRQFPIVLSAEKATGAVYARLDATALESLNLSSKPRPDLLHRWAEPLRTKLEGWEIDWAPAKKGKDRTLWIRAQFPKGRIAENFRNDFVDAVTGVVNARNVRYERIFYMQPSTCTIVLQSPAAREQFVSTPLIISYNEENVALDASPFRVIQPRWGFELVVAGLSNSDPTIIYGQLESFFVHGFMRDGQSTYHSGRLVGEDSDLFCFVMVDWDATLAVMGGKTQFLETFDTYGLTTPCLVYDANADSGLLYRKTATTSIRDAGTAVAADIRQVHNMISDLRLEMTQQIERMGERITAGFEMTDRRLAQHDELMTTIGQNVASLTNQVHQNSTALLAFREDSRKAEYIATIHMHVLDIKWRIRDAKDDKEASTLRADLAEVQSMLEDAKKERMTVSAALSQALLTSPDSTALRQSNPVSPPGITHPSKASPEKASTANAARPPAQPTPPSTPSKSTSVHATPPATPSKPPRQPRSTGNPKPATTSQKPLTRKANANSADPGPSGDNSESIKRRKLTQVSSQTQIPLAESEEESEVAMQIESPEA